MLAAANNLSDVSSTSASRTNLGLGTIATQAANSVAITGGSISGITDLAVADGGTGASTASAARTNLGLVIGTDVQAYDAGLADIAGLAVTDGNVIVGNGSNWVAESGATARTSLGLGTMATQAATGVDIDGGTIDGATIGGTSAGAVTATTLTATDASVISASSSSDALRITQTGAGNALKVEDSTNPDSTPFVVNASGNVGIGTSSPTHMLTVGEDGSNNPGQISLGRGGLEDAKIFFTRAGNNDAEITYNSDEDLYIKNNFAAGDVVYSNNLGEHIFKYGSAGAAEAMRIDSSGNVGIGTSSPALPLHISSATPAIRLTDTDDNSDAQVSAAAGGLLVLDADIGNEVAGTAILFRVDGGSEKMRIDSSGNVGIGTASPDAKLGVYSGSLGTTDGDQLELARFISAASNGSYLRVFTERDGDGTNWTTAFTRIQQRVDTTDQGYIQFNGADNLYGISIGNNNTEYMRIENGGNVGIGTSSPAAALDVSGTARATQGMPIITEAGTAKTLALTDNGGYVRTTSGSAVTITVPLNSSVAFPTGAEIVVFQDGAGLVTFAATGGVTIKSKDSNLSLGGQYSAATLKKVATDTWDLIGDLA